MDAGFAVVFEAKHSALPPLWQEVNKGQWGVGWGGMNGTERRTDWYGTGSVPVPNLQRESLESDKWCGTEKCTSDFTRRLLSHWRMTERVEQFFSPFVFVVSAVVVVQFTS